MKRNTLLMILIVCTGIMIMSTGAFAADQPVTVDGNKIFANGNAIIIDKVSNPLSHLSNIYLDKGTIGTYEAGIDTLVDLSSLGMTAANGGYDLSYHSIYGGNNIDGAVGDTRITVLGGSVGSILGGSGSSGSKTGNTHITIENGTFKGIYGGGYAKDVDSTNIIINGGNFNETLTYIFGGGAGGGSVTENTNITINDGNFYSIYGGGAAAGSDVGGNTNLTINGGAFSENIFGGGNFGSIVGSTNISITNGNFNTIYGGGNQNGTVGSTNLTISGGEISTLYAGGRQNNITSTTDVLISGGTFNNIYGGGNPDGTDRGIVVGNKQIKISGGSITSTVDDYTDGRLTKVDGTTPVYKTTLTLPDISSETDISGSLTLGEVASSYGLTDVKTTDSGLLIFYLPTGDATALYNSLNYTETVEENNNNSFVLVPAIPSEPTGVIATAGDTQASVAFNPPASNGGSAITEYTVTSSPGVLAVTGGSSPIIVTGLTNGTAYTFTVTATNSVGTGPASPASDSVTPNADPLITSVVVPANGTYTTGQNLDFTVNFSETVNVTGWPYLTINIGGSNVNAEYISGSGSSSLVFRYTISNENDADGITITSPMVENSSTITGSTSGIALTNWALANVGSTTSVLVDTQATQATPTFNPGAGVIASGSTVTITSPGADAIYYTIDGTDPTTASINQATTPLLINSDVTVKAIAVKAGRTDSAIGTAVYTQTVLPSTYTMMEISNQTLTSVTAGYGSGTQETKNLTITRTGTGDLANLATSISGSNFTITQPGVTTLNDDTTSTTFTVKANDGLVAGTYTETVTVSADNMTSETFTVTQVVNAVSGGGRGGSSDDSSPSPAPAPVATILKDIKTSDEQTIEDSLQQNGEARIDLTSTSTRQTDITENVINQLFQMKKPLNIIGEGVNLQFEPNALQNGQINGENNNVTVQIGAAPISNEEKEELLAATSLGQSAGVFQVGGQIFNFIAQRSTTTDGSTSTENIGNFAEPVAVTIDLSNLNLTTEQISQLTGTRLDKNESGEIVPVFLGGTYDEISKNFTFYTEKFSLYTVLQKKDLVILNLAIDNTITKINGKNKTIDVPPSLINNRTFVPLRYIGETLGASFEWDNDTRTVTFQCVDQTLNLVVGQNISGMDIGPVIVNGRTMVPLRYISENFGAQVMWFPNSRSVSVVK